MPRTKEGDGPKPRHWWNTFQAAKYPAYVTLVEPPALSDHELRQRRCRVKRLLLDDVLDDPAAYGQGKQPRQIDISEGSFILILPGVEANENKSLVPPPWLCRVKSIWFLPGQQQQQQKKRRRPSKSASTHEGSTAAAAAAGPKPRYRLPIGSAPDVVLWEQSQLAEGRLAAQHFQLQVTYFYRWPDLYEQVKDSPVNEQKFLQSLLNLGIADSMEAARKLAMQRGAGGAPPSHYAMRYVIFSNHDTPEPLGGGNANDAGNGAGQLPDDENDDDDDEAAADSSNTPAPLESVMTTANVLFLESGAQLPYMEAAVPAKAAANDPRGLPAAVLTRLRSRHKQLPHSFICNMFLVQGDGEEGEARLYGLQEWGEGRASSSRCSGSAQRSRQLVKQLIAASKAELSELPLLSGGSSMRQQQQPGRGQAAAAAAARAAAAAAGGVDGSSSSSEDDEEDEQQLPSPTNKKRRIVLESTSDTDEEDEEAAGEDEQAAPAAVAAAGAGAGAAESGEQQQEQNEEQDGGGRAQEEEEQEDDAAAAAAGDDDDNDDDDDDDDSVEVVEEGQKGSGAATAGGTAAAAAAADDDDDDDSSDDASSGDDDVGPGGKQQQRQQQHVAAKASSSSDQGGCSDSSSGGDGTGAAAAPQSRGAAAGGKKQGQAERQQQAPREQRQQRTPQQQQQQQQQPVQPRHKIATPAQRHSSHTPATQQPHSASRQRVTPQSPAAAAAAGAAAGGRGGGGRAGSSTPNRKRSSSAGAGAAKTTLGRRKGP